MSFPVSREGVRGRRVTRQKHPAPGAVVHFPRQRAQVAFAIPEKHDLTPFVISMRVQKSINSPVGTFGLTLLPVPRQDNARRRGPGRLDLPPTMYSNIRPGDLIMVGYEVPGGLMMGFVDKVSRNVQQGPDASATLTIEGSDFGKLLEQDAIIHPSPAAAESATFFQQVENVVGRGHPLSEVMKGIWGPEVGAQGKERVRLWQAVSVADVVDFVLNNAVSTRLPYQPFGIAFGGQRPGEFIEPVVSTIGEAEVFNEGLNSYQGNIWGLLRNAIDPDFYEMYFQTTPVRSSRTAAWEPVPRVQFVVRPKPYDEVDLNWWPTQRLDLNWGTLTPALNPEIGAWEIGRELDMGHSFGRSDADVFSYYEVVARHDLVGNDLAFNLGLYYPLVDTFQLTRYGLRAYRSQVGLVGNQFLRAVDPDDPTPSLDEGEARDEVKEARGRLFNWYRIADFFEDGQITVPGNDLYRPGDPFQFPWLTPWIGGQRGMWFYCTAITWTWEHGQPYTAQLELIRGHNSGVIEAAKREIDGDRVPANPRNFLEV